MSDRTPTFSECERLAILASNLAGRARAYAEASTHPELRERHMQEARDCDRMAEILDDLRGRSSPPLKTQSRYGGGR